VQELFNLCHASALNIIECIFGVLKWHFRILVHPPQFSMDIQARLPPALAAVHNFIHKHDPNDLADYEDVEDPQPGTCAGEQAAEGQLAAGLPRAAERAQANARHDKIMQDMWVQYQDELARHGIM
jgi:hypothetical protein